MQNHRTATYQQPTVSAVSPTQLAAARAWLSDCDWTDADADLIGELPPTVTYLAVDAHYAGGWPQFLLDRGLVSIERLNLTLYRLTVEGENPLDVFEPLLVLGRDAADREAAELMGRPDVLSVQSDPLVWGSHDEDDVILSSYFNGADLHTPVAAIADLIEVDYDPTNFDPVALLAHLRSLVTAP